VGTASSPRDFSWRCRCDKADVSVGPVLLLMHPRLKMMPKHPTACKPHQRGRSAAHGPSTERGNLNLRESRSPEGPLTPGLLAFSRLFYGLCSCLEVVEPPGGGGRAVINQSFEGLWTSVGIGSLPLHTCEFRMHWPPRPPPSKMSSRARKGQTSSVDLRKNAGGSPRPVQTFSVCLRSARDSRISSLTGISRRKTSPRVARISGDGCLWNHS